MKPTINALTSSRNPIAGAIAALPAALASQRQQEAASPTSPPPTSDELPARWIGLEQFAHRTEASNDTRDDDLGFFVRERALARSIVAQRFIQARELNGLSQSEGSRLLGFAASGQLSQIESGKKIPLLAIVRLAAERFGVSADFLLGLSDETDRDPRKARRVAMRSLVDAGLRSMADALADVGECLIDEGQSVECRQLADAAEKVVETFEKVAARPDFLDIRGGASLAHAMKGLSDVLAPALRAARRHQALEVELRGRLAASREIGKVACIVRDCPANMEP